ncbi:MAG: GTPase Era [Candidatus Cloacimonetes bacterium]|nr:GTPase Era [Candidatus Cloacimonadota bacterium]
MLEIDPNHRSGFICITGRPNVGKSTLMNQLLGERLSIISPKPQTTRNAIKGILTTDTEQMVFVDTPGLVQPRYELQIRMRKYIEQSINSADIVLFVTAIKQFPTDYDNELMELILRQKTPVIAVLNKKDIASPELLEQKLELMKTFNFERILSLSALHGDGVEELLKAMKELLPLSPPLYSENQLTDLPIRFFVQEIIREQIFLIYGQEIPYSSTVIVEDYKDFPNKAEIHANIWLERASQKPIVLGKGGSKIKQVRLQAEKLIHDMIGKRVKLDLWIKIKKNWRKKKNALNEFGYY